MRLPFPERIPIWYSVVFALVLGAVQLMQGTDFYFSFGCATFIVLSTLAFNTAGGFSRPSGAYIFLNATLTVIVGIVYKAYLGEAAHTNLVTPRMTILVYNVGMVGMLTAAYLSRRFSRREGFLQNMLPLNRMQGAVYGCLAMGALINLINRFSPGANGSLISAVNQVDRFLSMSILLGVTHQIRKSGGRSSLNAPVLLVMGIDIGFGGLLGYSKESFLIPIMAWLLTAASLRYRFSLMQAGGILLSAAFFFYYLVPYAQYGRVFRDVDTTFSAQIQRATYLLSHLDETRQIEKQVSTESYTSLAAHYYDSPQGLWDRLQMLAMDDALINYTETQHPYGYYPIIFNVENIVPHFIWKSKPVMVFGNLYAHEIGALAPDDFSTGVSFSPTGESWHIGRWVCLTLVAPAIWTLFFVVFDSLGGDVRKSPWGLLAIILFAHVASEGGIGYVLYELFYGVAAMLFVSYFSSRIVPHLGALIIGPARRPVERAPAVHSIPRRDAAI